MRVRKAHILWVFLMGCGCTMPPAGMLPAPSPAVLAETDYKAIVAAAVNYRAGSKPPRSLHISEPWIAVGGDLGVCVREDTPDGKGGFFPVGATKLYFIDKQRITNVVDHPNCMEGRAPGPLPALPRRT